MAKKRSPNSGSVYKRKDGTWIASLRHEGKRYERRAQSKAAANEKLAELKRLVMLDVDPSRMLVGELVERYLKHVAAHNEETTHDSYQSVLRHASGLFQRSLTEVGPMSVSNVVDEIQSTQTRRKVFQTPESVLHARAEMEAHSAA